MARSIDSTRLGQLFGSFWTSSELAGLDGGNLSGGVASVSSVTLGNFTLHAITGISRDDAAVITYCSTWDGRI